MTETFSNYAVGYGKPPVHTRFQKGQSGNPSGKPGPAKLAKQRFERALWAALDAKPDELELSKPANILAAIARKMALEACEGRIAATRLLLSVIDAESEKPSGAEDDAADELFTAAELFSLLQGKRQGNGKDWLDEILGQDGDAVEAVTPPCGDGAAPHPENARTEHVSALSAKARFSTSPPGGGSTSAFSLAQGKTQGNGKNPPEEILGLDVGMQVVLVATPPCGGNYALDIPRY